MSLTIHDPASANILGTSVGHAVEVFGPDGRLLGRFTPAPRPGMAFPEFGMSDEDIEKIIKDPNAKWHSGEEVMARLSSLRDAK
ncbi:MAG: hypothetical protein ACRC8S_11445 [Fimbriiglobus sp.]